ncbi:MAG: hypothetical protein Q8R83_06755 [Legionellaceae bacterium]|nr:hypothetical protein [Legionellaceae bacterium]
MNKTKITLLSSVIFSLSLTVQAASCPSATRPSAPGFCSSFKIAAECHCISSGLPRGMCMNHELLYKRMITTFGSLQKACEFQHDISAQECIDDWNCFRFGGLTSSSELCSGTGAACA